MTPLLETSPKGTHVRLRQQWPEWVLPNAVANEEVKKEFEEAEKNKEANKSDEVEEGEIVEDKKEETEKETKVEEPTKEVETAPTATETETKTPAEDVVEKSSSPDADAVSIRSPTLKSQCEFYGSCSSLLFSEILMSLCKTSQLLPQITFHQKLSQHNPFSTLQSLQ